MLADRIGRKNVFMMTLVLFSVASGLSALTMTLTAFLILRFFVGAGLGGELPVASTFVSESVEAKERGRVVVLLESFWAAGWLIAALIAYFIIPDYGWRVALIITALPAFYAIYLRRKLPDSPKFEADGKPKQSAVEKIKDNLVEKVCTTDTYALDCLVHGRIFVLWYVSLVTECHGNERL